LESKKVLKPQFGKETPFTISITPDFAVTTYCKIQLSGRTFFLQEKNIVTAL